MCPLWADTVEKVQAADATANFWDVISIKLNLRNVRTGTDLIMNLSGVVLAVCVRAPDESWKMHIRSLNSDTPPLVEA